MYRAVILTRPGATTNRVERCMSSFVREFGLVPNRSDSERFIRLVRWEARWSAPDAEGFESATLVPTVWEYRVLERRDPERGISWHAAVPVIITELRMRQLASPVWPREATTEPEALRRARIRAIRAACHVDQATGLSEPDWSESAEDTAAVVQRLEQLRIAQNNPAYSDAAA